jgi:hypothetical protein
LFGIWLLFDVRFYLLLISDHRYLDVSLFEKIQGYEKKTLSSSKREAKQVFLDQIDPICFLPLVTLLHAFLKLNTYLPLGLEIVSG